MSRALSWLAVLLLVAACATSPSTPRKAAEPRPHIVYVVSNGWHSGIVVRRDALLAVGAPPEAAYFPDADYLEFGWGDRAYYPANDVAIGMTLKAAFVPTKAIMHVAGLRHPAQFSQAETEIVAVALSRDGFRRMATAISQEIERPTDGLARPVSQGLHPGGVFFNARGAFHLFNTCNTWTATMLSRGGVEISPSGVITAGALMENLRGSADVIDAAQ